MWSTILDILNPSRKSAALYQEVLANLRRASAPRVGPVALLVIPVRY